MHYVYSFYQKFADVIGLVMFDLKSKIFFDKLEQFLVKVIVFSNVKEGIKCPFEVLLLVKHSH